MQRLYLSNLSQPVPYVLSYFVFTPSSSVVPFHILAANSLQLGSFSRALLAPLLPPPEHVYCMLHSAPLWSVRSLTFSQSFDHSRCLPTSSLLKKFTRFWYLFLDLCTCMWVFVNVCVCVWLCDSWLLCMCARVSASGCQHRCAASLACTVQGSNE